MIIDLSKPFSVCISVYKKRPTYFTLAVERIYNRTITSDY